MEQIEICDNRARLSVVPELGAGIASYEALHEDGTAVPLLRSWDPSVGTDPFALACNLLLPWSNRISGGGFAFQGQFHPLEPNYPGEKYPLHGNGFQVPWAVSQRDASSVALELCDSTVGPFRYTAVAHYELRDGSLIMELAMENKAKETLPYGLGFHPWFPRNEGTRLWAPAETVWHENAEHLPAHEEPVSKLPGWDFSQANVLPEDWINNGFTGWNRKAQILQPEDGLMITLSVSERLGIYLLFSPSAESEFFCFEPVSHLVDAHNLKGTTGLVALKPGDRISAHLRVDWDWDGRQHLRQAGVQK